MMWFTKPSTVTVEGSRLVDCNDLADIHRASFQQGWSASEFATLIDSDNVRAMQARRPATFFRPASSGPAGFVLTRLAADEAEILTIAVCPTARGFGLGRALMEAVMRDLYADRIASLFLEVDETNNAAIKLYRKLGFDQVGQRESYYQSQASGSADATLRTRALVMRCDLR